MQSCKISFTQLNGWLHTWEHNIQKKIWSTSLLQPVWEEESYGASASLQHVLCGSPGSTDFVHGWKTLALYIRSISITWTCLKRLCNDRCESSKQCLSSQQIRKFSNKERDLFQRQALKHALHCSGMISWHALNSEVHKNGTLLVSSQSCNM